MAIYRCKSCGGELNVQKGTNIVECDYCGIKQSVPTTDDENIQRLFNRANALRIRGEFDKAEQIYEKILQSNEKEAEAYWGIVLCKYGIEYVEDPETFKRVPTCHRASLHAITSDEDYKSALLYADVIQKDIYEEEAKIIDYIQKEILKISQNEEPYDVFICYKETDGNGERTIDSTIANEIYHELTEMGLKVFYAAITLEEKLGQEYEPYIFAALNSAKVMLVIGTKPEYFNAVWVKNEWSRFLKLMKNNRSKTLIPCYRDMDAYELPEEFSNLQAQDMSKIGFIIDIVRGIKKIVDWEKETDNEEEKKEDLSENPSIEPLLKRAFMFLEDKNWESAQEYCERVLDMEPENAKAYLCKLMADCYVSNLESLALCRYPFDNNDNYKKVLRFGDEELVNTLKEYIVQIEERIEKERLSTLYSKALEYMKCAQTSKDYEAARWEFAQIEEYKDSKMLAERCAKAAEKEREEEIEYEKMKKLYDQAVDHMSYAKTAEAFEAVQWEFAQIEDFENSKDLAEYCAKKAEAIRKFAETKKKSEIYDKALELSKSDQAASLSEAITHFRMISDFKDSNQKIIECQAKVDDLTYRTSSKLTIFIIIGVIVLIGVLFSRLSKPQNISAEELVEQKIDSNVIGNIANKYVEGEEYETVIEKIEYHLDCDSSEISREAAEMILKEKMMIYGNHLIEQADYAQAYEFFQQMVQDFENSTEILERMEYANGMVSYEKNDYEMAVKLFERAEYVGEEYLESCYMVGKKYFAWESRTGYIKASQYFEKIESYNYKDANQLLEEARTKIE